MKKGKSDALPPACFALRVGGAVLAPGTAITRPLGQGEAQPVMIWRATVVLSAARSVSSFTGFGCDSPR